MSMQRNREWWVNGWTHERGEPSQHWPSGRLVSELADRLADDDDDDDAEVSVSKGTLRSLLAAVERHGLEQVPGAAVTDKASGVTYRATIARKGSRPYLSSLAIDVPEGVKIDGRFLAAVPADRLADAVAQYESVTAETGRSPLVVLPPEAVTGRGFVPDLSELAARFERDKAADVVADYMREYGVSRATVYRWVALARDEGLLPEATTGRPRKADTQTPGGKGRRATREKGTDNR